MHKKNLSAILAIGFSIAVQLAHAADESKPPKTSPPSNGASEVYEEVPSPMSALEQCKKGCVVLYKGKWRCVTDAEAAAPPMQEMEPYVRHGNRCTGPPANLTAASRK